MSIKLHNRSRIIVSVCTLYYIASEKLILIFTLFINFLISPERAKFICLCNNHFGFFRNSTLADIGCRMGIFNFDFNEGTYLRSIPTLIFSEGTYLQSIPTLVFSEGTYLRSIPTLIFSEGTYLRSIPTLVFSEGTCLHKSQSSKTQKCG